MLCGAIVPFVVRPIAEGKYTLIGEILLHGCMRREMVTEELKGRIGQIYLA
jgi:hypothetical protein